ncbi:MAG: hypothetical protein H0T77_10635 [Pyrinomonadaceae bacterium]|nr:hypothetical protein [Pyrinomonadaceae bacterium]
MRTAYDPNSKIKDFKVNNSPADWAAYGGHQGLSDYLEQIAKAQILAG